MSCPKAFLMLYCINLGPNSNTSPSWYIHNTEHFVHNTIATSHLPRCYQSFPTDGSTHRVFLIHMPKVILGNGIGPVNQRSGWWGPSTFPLCAHLCSSWQFNLANGSLSPFTWFRPTHCWSRVFCFHTGNVMPHPQLVLKGKYSTATSPKERLR